MQRRTFLTTAGLLGAMPFHRAFAGQGDLSQQERTVFELRKYHLLNTANQERLHAYLREAALPALNRIGIEPVGVFNVTYGPSEPTVYVLLPHPSLESVLTVSSRLADDATYQEEAAPFEETSISDPAFVRMESELKLAFEGMPELEAPDTSEARIFELRTYESHNAEAARRKVEMFNEGEIAIFRRTGLQPVFFAESIIGPDLPNLTYMLVFEGMEEREASWERFVNDPEWEEMSQDSYYADTVSNITDFILEPTSYSQV